MNSQQLKQIVIDHPNCARVLEKYGLDFCCGGNDTLGDACAKKSLDTNSVVSALQQEIDREQQNAGTYEDTNKKLQGQSCEELVRDIISTHHAYLREEIPPLKQLLDKVTRVHGPRHGELQELNSVTHAVLNGLLAHIDEEERGIFKVLQEGNYKSPLIREWISNLEAEHQEHGQSLERIKNLTNQYQVPADGCGSYRALFSRLKHLEEDTHLHVHKENYILFPKVLAKI